MPKDEATPFEMIIQVSWSEPDRVYVAHCYAEPFRHLSARGGTREDALREFAFLLDEVMREGQRLPAGEKTGAPPSSPGRRPPQRRRSASTPS